MSERTQETVLNAIFMPASNEILNTEFVEVDAIRVVNGCKVGNCNGVCSSTS